MIETYEAYLWRQVDTHIGAARDALQQLWQTYSDDEDGSLIHNLHSQLGWMNGLAKQRYTKKVAL